MNNFGLIGRVLIVIGMAMTVAKWFFGVDVIERWNLIPLVSGLALTWAARSRSKEAPNG
ncbi:MAG: hypothetical protein HC788_05960 [Sphingopyxis sp.]|nr:hypothetical protein [Sphingopyxis sp.]